MNCDHQNKDSGVRRFFITISIFMLVQVGITEIPLYSEQPPYPNKKAATKEIAVFMETTNDTYMQCLKTQESREKVGPNHPTPKLTMVDPIDWPKQDSLSSKLKQGRIILEVLVSKTGAVICSRILSCTVPDLAVAKASLAINHALHFEPALYKSGDPISGFYLVSIKFLEDGTVKIE